MNHIKGLFIETPKSLYVAANCTVKTGVGVAASAISTVTIGKIDAIEGFAGWTKESYGILPNIFSIPRKIISPKKECDYQLDDGYLTRTISEKVYKFIVNKANEPASLKNRAILLVSYIGYVVSTTITRVADLVLGILLAPLSFGATLANAMTMGKVKSLNDIEHKLYTFTRDQFSSLAIIDDLSWAFRSLPRFVAFR